MPYPGVPKSLTKKMERCVEDVMKDGKSKEAAIRICKSRIAPKKDFTLSERESRVRNRWRLIWAEAAKDNPDLYVPWLRWIFDDYAVIDYEGEYFLIPYSWESNDVNDITFDFDALVVVEHTFSPVRSLTLNPIRSVQGSDFEYETYAVLFGSPSERDLHQTYFNETTRFYLDWFNERPWLYDHALRPRALVETRSSRIGTWKSAEIDDMGVFVKGELDRRHKYVEAVKELLDEEALFPSSGTLEYAMRVAPDGLVLDWPIVEISSTVAPSEYRTRPFSESARRAIDLLDSKENRRFTMSFREALDKLRGGRSADVEEDVEEVETDAVDAEEEGADDAPVEEGTDSDVAAEVADLSENVKSLIGVVQRMDGILKAHDEQFGNLRTVVNHLAKDRIESVRTAVADPQGWQDELYVATRSADPEGDSMTEDEEQATRTANQQVPVDDKGNADVFNATRIS